LIPADRFLAAGFLFSAHLFSVQTLFCKKTRKRKTQMANPTDTNKVAQTAAGLGISFDAWAVALALAFALIVKLGWIKHIPW
jgi:hypothetical protein